MVTARVRVKGRAIRFLESGVGKPLVFIHGFPLNAEMWAPQLERVPEGWRFIAPDLRGFGETPIDADDIGTDDYAADVLGLMDALGFDRCVVAGLSLGGYVAFALVRLAPHRLSGLVLADTKATADTED